MKNYRPVSGDGLAPAILNHDLWSGFTIPGKSPTTALQFSSHARSVYRLLLAHWLVLLQRTLCLSLEQTETPLKQTETFHFKLKRFRSYQPLTQKFAETLKILKTETALAILLLTYRKKCRLLTPN
jgi:hypothetical protein